MEKFARQSVSDNVETAEDLKVTRDSELYRSLNLHYNKSNEFTVSPFNVCFWAIRTYSNLRMFLSFLYQSLLLFNSLWLSMFVTIHFFTYCCNLRKPWANLLENFPEIWMHTKNGILLCASSCAFLFWLCVVCFAVYRFVWTNCTFTNENTRVLDKYVEIDYTYDIYLLTKNYGHSGFIYLLVYLLFCYIDLRWESWVFAEFIFTNKNIKA